MNKNIIDLSKHEQKIFSQNGEDGILLKILESIGFEKKFCFEIGVGDGTECNTRILWQNHGFNNLMFDSNYPSNPSINLVQEHITMENILGILQKYNVPVSADVFSLDTDLNDFYFMKEILKYYVPRVVITEHNSIFPWDEDKVVIYSPQDYWSLDNYQHATLMSWWKLFSFHNYSLVYCERAGINAFWVYKPCILENVDFLNRDNVKELYVKRGWNISDQKNREFIDFDRAMKVVNTGDIYKS